MTEKLHPEVSKFLRGFTRVSTGKHYFFIPCWFEECGTDAFIVHPLGNLPKELTDAIEKVRNHPAELPGYMKEFIKPLPSPTGKQPADWISRDEQGQMYDGKRMSGFMDEPSQTATGENSFGWYKRMRDKPNTGGEDKMNFREE